MIKHLMGNVKTDKYKLFGIKAAQFLITVGLFYFSFLWFRYGRIVDLEQTGFRYNYFAAVLYAVMLVFFSRAYNSFLLGYRRIRQLVAGQFLSQILSLGLAYLIVSLAWNHFNSPMVFVAMLLIQLALDILWSYWANSVFYKLHGKRRTLLIYRNQVDKKRFGIIKGKPTERMYEITDQLQYDGTFADLQKQLEGYDAVFVAGVNSSCRNGILKYCKENGIPGFFLPHIGDTIMQDAKHVKAFDAPVLYVGRKELDPEYAIAKRLFDIMSSGIALILLSPIILITALVIHFYDGGPAFYRQTRLTRNGKGISDPEIQKHAGRRGERRHSKAEQGR